MGFHAARSKRRSGRSSVPVTMMRPCLTLEHLFDMVALPHGPTGRRNPCSPRPSRPRSTWASRSTRSRSAWWTWRPRAAPPPTAGSPRSGRSSTGGANGSASFQALVNPEIPIPPFITHLTGIDDRSARLPSRRSRRSCPAFLEFCRGAVFVAHNARFDFSFLNANLTRLDYDPLPGARRLHGAAGAPRRLARRSQRQAADARSVLPHASAAQPPGVRRRRGLRRGAPRAARPGRAARHPDARRPARGRARPGATALRQDPPGRPPAARSRRVPVPRLATAGCCTSASRRTCAPA